MIPRAGEARARNGVDLSGDPQRSAMSRLLAATLALLACSPAAAQTCGGSLRLEFSEAKGRGSPRVLRARDLAVTAAYFLGDPNGLLTADEARRDATVEADGTEALGAGARLSAAGSAVRVRTGCGLALVHLRIQRGRRTMTLDVYRAPDHVPAQLDAPVPFRAGRHVLDLWTARRVSTGGSPYVYSAAAVRRADE